MYQATSNPNVILRTTDGAWIPVDTNNADYRGYLAWVAAGNTILPV